MSALVPPAAHSSYFRAASGTRIHTLSWNAEGARAVVLLSHGLGEHAARYAPLARDLVPRGISVRALDHRGHGRSGGIRGYAPRFAALVDDFEAFRLRATEDVDRAVEACRSLAGFPWFLPAALAARCDPRREAFVVLPRRVPCNPGREGIRPAVSAGKPGTALA